MINATGLQKPAKPVKPDTIVIETEPDEPDVVFPIICPTNAAHEKTRVYRRQRNLISCCCDDCGATWTTGAKRGPVTVRDPNWHERLKRGGWTPVEGRG